MYDRLADFLIENLDFHGVSVILEAGCGRGQLTIPFAKKVMRILREFKIIAFDVSSGPYKGDLGLLQERARGEHLEKFIVTVKGDIRDMGAIEDESIDILISNELFCDLDRKGLEKALKEFRRILRPKGQMAHGELIPVPENPAQKLLIEADSSMESLMRKYEWFSPFSDEVAVLMHKLGFKNITAKYFEPDVRLSFNDAVEQLRKWNTDPSFIEEHTDELKKHGLEFPIEHVVFCKKICD
jgi:ubiquinone/menaquinone biosynthesis C-methylase UbiE